MEKTKNHTGNGFLSDNNFMIVSRRVFLKDVAIATSGLIAAPALLNAARAGDEFFRHNLSRNNSLPGRIIILHDDNLSQSGTVDMNRAEMMVCQGVKALTGKDDTGEAFQSLFPGITSTSKIAIKVNVITTTDTRWETARGVVSGLSKMFKNSYDVSKVTLYDKDNLPLHGYSASRFTFNGKTAQIQSTPNCNSGIYPVSGHELSSWIADADYVINMPVIKDHNSNQLTLAFKNHYGSINPSSLCGQYANMLTMNAHTEIKDKTCLILMDAIYGIWRGGPHGAPQSWTTFPAENTPNSYFLSTDPVTLEYWGRDCINTERKAHSYSPYAAAYIEQSAGSPFYLGIASPGEMDVVNLYCDRIVLTVLEYPSSVKKGETLTYKVKLTNTDTQNSASFDKIRLEVQGPIKKTIPIFSNKMTLKAGQAVADYVDLAVPTNAPAGSYTLQTIVSYLKADFSQASFTCQVTS